MVRRLLGSGLIRCGRKGGGVRNGKDIRSTVVNTVAVDVEVLVETGTAVMVGISVTVTFPHNS